MPDITTPASMTLKSISSFTAAVFTVAVLAFSACKKDNCKDVICQPCPSSRFMISYLDSSGKCLPTVQANTTFYAYADTDTFYMHPPLFSYGFSADSCQAALLIENYKYVVVCTNPAFHDTIIPKVMTYQDPLEVTSCCLCYPVKMASITINRVENSVDFPTGQYQSPIWVRTLH